MNRDPATRQAVRLLALERRARRLAPDYAAGLTMPPLRHTADQIRALPHDDRVDLVRRLTVLELQLSAKERATVRELLTGLEQQAQPISVSEALARRNGHRDGWSLDGNDNAKDG